MSEVGFTGPNVCMKREAGLDQPESRTSIVVILHKTPNLTTDHGILEIILSYGFACPGHQPALHHVEIQERLKPNGMPARKQEV